MTELTTPSPELRALALNGEASRSERPRIYVACLAAYNNGRLHGRWIDATTPDEIRAEVCAMLAASPEPDPEEWAIHGATRKSHLLSEAGMPLVEPVPRQRP